MEKINQIIKKNIKYDHQNSNTIVDSNNHKLEKSGANRVDELDFSMDVHSSFDYSNIESDGFTVQGYTYVKGSSGDKIFISAYAKDHTSNSRIYVYDPSSGNMVGKIILNNKNHVGGITYDQDNNILFVSANNGKVETYNYLEICSMFDELKLLGSSDITLRLNYNSDDLNEYERERIKLNFDRCIIKNNINVKDVVSKKNALKIKATENILYQDGMDSIYFYNGILYSNTYSYNGKLVSSKLNLVKDSEGRIIKINDGNNHDGSVVVGNVGSAVQGMSFYNKNGKDYLITSSSAKGMSSLLTRYELDNSGNIIKIGSKTISRQGLEGISVDDKGNITGIFEYNDKNVLNIGDDVGNNFIIGNVNELTEKVDTITDVSLKVGASYWDFTNGEDDSHE